MLVLYGSATTLIDSKRSPTATCIYCNNTGQLDFNRYARTFHVMFIPICPTQVTDEISCVACNSIFHYKDLKEDIRKQYKPFKSNRIPPFWHFTGILLVLGLLVWGKSAQAMRKQQQQEVISERLTQAEKGRIVVYKDETGTYSSFRICRASQQTIWAVFNTYETSSPGEMSRVTDESFFAADTISLNRDSLWQMFEQGRIHSVSW